MYIIHIRIYIYMQHVLMRRHISGPVWWSISSTGPPGLHFWAVSPWCFTSAAWPCWWLTVAESLDAAPEHPLDSHIVFWINIHLPPIFHVQQGTMVLTHSHTCFACFLLLLWCALGNHWEFQNPMHAWHLSIDLLLGSPRWTWSAWDCWFYGVLCYLKWWDIAAGYPKNVWDLALWGNQFWYRTDHSTGRLQYVLRR